MRLSSVPLSTCTEEKILFYSWPHSKLALRMHWKPPGQRIGRSYNRGTSHDQTDPLPRTWMSQILIRIIMMWCHRPSHRNWFFALYKSLFGRACNLLHNSTHTTATSFLLCSSGNSLQRLTLGLINIKQSSSVNSFSTFLLAKLVPGTSLAYPLSLPKIATLSLSMVVYDNAFLYPVWVQRYNSLLRN